MTEFQLSILAIGGTVVVGVFIYNKWQEYRARKVVDNAFADGQEDDVLLRAEHEQRHEPSFQQAEPESELKREPKFDESAELSVAADIEPTEQAEQAQSDGAQPAVKPAQAETNEGLIRADLPVDELIDSVIVLELDTPVRAEKILNEITGFKFVGKKPVHFIGQTVEGQRTVIRLGEVYSCLFAGVQMVARSGPVTELEYSEFVTKIRTIADNLGAHPDIPDMNKVIRDARELQQFVSEHDAQLSINVAVNGAPWALATLLAALEKMGFDQRPDGRLMMPDGDGGSLFTLSTNVGLAETSTTCLTLLLDVPCVEPGRDAFGAMAACARSLATRLGGVVVDDSRQPISTAALEEINGQVQEFYGAMQEAQIPAGSLRAKRIFS